ncbi:MAG: HIT family protein [Sulfurovaceae bacterium]|nr:HIT family protein [Sulfurovaceae bacterium]
MSIIWQNENLEIRVEASSIPWLKIFTLHPYREMSEVPKETRNEIYELLDTIEKVMLEYYNPKKINIASFGNYVPHVHWHIMARFELDSHFPEPMWGAKQREGRLELPEFEGFIKILLEKLKLF